MAGTRDLGVATPGSTGYRRRWWALAVLCLSLVVLAMDNTILNVTLPTLARDLGATGSQLQWMVDAYLLVFAGLLLTMGALGDRFGRKLALNVGLLVFVAASAASAFAGSPEVLIATRAAMGIGAALIMPATLSIITNTFPPTERGRAIGVWAGMAALGVVLGPVVGGWLLEGFWWGSVFLINLPVVALAMLAGWPLVPESRDPNATPLDPTGAALSVAALITLVYAIIQAPEDGWTDPLILAAFGVAAVLSGGFGWWERRIQHPMLPMELFRNPRFSAASGAIAMAFFALFGSVFLLTQHLQFVLGYTPLQTGVRVLPVGALIVAAPLAARLVERLGTKLVVVAGLLLVAGALWLLSTVEITDGYGPVAATLALLGIGMGLTVAPATESIMGSLPLAKAGVGSAMNDTTRQIGGALGVAVLGSILAAGYGAAVQPALRSAPPPIAQTAGDSIGAAATIAARLGPAGQGLLEAARSAFLQGMGDAVQVGAGAATLAAVLVLLFLPARGKEQAPVREGAVEIEAARVDGQGPERAGHRGGKERRMHVITVTRRTAATPKAIWRLWADVPNRTRWDDALERITLEGPFQSGATGIVKLRGQPERRFEVVQSVPPRAYTDRFLLPLGAKMDWAHTISEADCERAVTFDISVTGPTALLLAPVLRRILRRELPPTLEKLIALAERTGAHRPST